MLIDSHCHLDRLDLTPYGGDFSRFIHATMDAGVSHMLCVAIGLETYPAMRRLVEAYPCVSVSVGVHPNEETVNEPDAETLAELAADEAVVAVGETGLDYFHGQAGCVRQHERFRSHIRAARMAGKPLIIHSREARADTLQILREEEARDVGGVFHCFTEDWETARAALDLNFLVSFSGIVTFKNAAQIQDVARRAPDDGFLIETDAPYLAPVPFRGKPNYPGYVKHVAEFVAQLRGTPWEAVAGFSTDNFRRLFALARV